MERHPSLVFSNSLQGWVFLGDSASGSCSPMLPPVAATGGVVGISGISSTSCASSFVSLLSLKGIHLRCIGPCRSSCVENHRAFPFLIWILFRHRRDGRGLVIHCLVRWPCTPWRRRWHSPGCRSHLLVNGMLYGSGFTRLNKIWVSYNISLTWILRPFGDDFPNINHDVQWGRQVRSWSNLPRFIESKATPNNGTPIPIMVNLRDLPSKSHCCWMYILPFNLQLNISTMWAPPLMLVGL